MYHTNISQICLAFYCPTLDTSLQYFFIFTFIERILKFRHKKSNITHTHTHYAHAHTHAHAHITYFHTNTLSCLPFSLLQTHFFTRCCISRPPFLQHLPHTHPPYGNTADKRCEVMSETRGASWRKYYTDLAISLATREKQSRNQVEHY